MLKNFKLNEVYLHDQYFAVRRELAKKYILEFDINRLMHTFKINGGLPSNAEPLGGWEDPKCDLRGHFVGHFLSACSKYAYADHDEALKCKAYEIVDIMEMCAKPNGYLSAFEEEKLDVLEAEENRNIWAPYYTLHKIMQGLVDCYLYLHYNKSLAIASNLAYYMFERFQKLSNWKIDGILRCTKLNPPNEFGGIGDSLYTLYEITGNSKILELAKIFDRDYFIGNLAAGRDVLEDLHSNTHLPMIISAMHRYNITGEEAYKIAALNFYRFLLGRTFVNGNSSSKAVHYVKGETSEKSEHWGAYGKLEDALTGCECESCCAHNTERILQKLLEWRTDVELLNHMELLKYNSILNSTSNMTGLSQYHQPLGNNSVKKFSDPYNTFWCCTASGIEAMSELQKNIWLKEDDEIFLNTWISSTVIWDDKKTKITQYTDYPDSLNATLFIEVDEPVHFKLRLKADSVKRVRINSIPVDIICDNGFITIDRVFQDKDQVDLDINASLHLVPLKGSEDEAAVMYGKILLAQTGENYDRSEISNHNISNILVKTDSNKLEFALFNDEQEKSSFIPLFRVEDEQYTVYNHFEKIRGTIT